MNSASASVSHVSARRNSTQGPLTPQVLCRQNQAFQGTAGVSAGNRTLGFAPAFLDTETGQVQPACHADGRPAALHLLDGLPEAWVLCRSASGRVLAVKPSVTAGFVRAGQFYTRQQAAQAAA